MNPKTWFCVEGTSVTDASQIGGDVAQRRDALVGRLFQGLLGTLDLLTVYVGDRLGLYQALADGGPATPPDLAGRTGTQERYVREWLEQQATAGILDVEDATAEPGARRYVLPDGHAEALLDRDSLSHIAPVGRFAACLGQALPGVLEAFRSGGGVDWADFGQDAREGQADFNRPIFLNLLGKEWLPSIPDVHARLTSDPPARVADVGCGAGWSDVAIAQAYPKVAVDGFDLDAPSIDLARQNAAGAGLADRVHFQVRDASDPALAGRYDLVLAFECVHDLPRPVEVLQTMRRLATEGGAVIIMDERVADSFTVPGGDVERLFYGFSVLC